MKIMIWRTDKTLEHRPKQCSHSFAHEFCFVKNFPTGRFINSIWELLRHRRIFWQFALKTSFGSGVFFAVPKIVDLNFNKNIQILSYWAKWNEVEESHKPDKSRFLMGSAKIWDVSTMRNTKIPQTQHDKMCVVLSNKIFRQILI